MKTCATCVSYRPESEETRPGCTKIVTRRTPSSPSPYRITSEAAGPPVVSMIVHSQNAYLQITEPDQFGCMLHEPRPAEPRIPGELWGVFDAATGEFADLIDDGDLRPIACSSTGAHILKDHYVRRPADSFVARIK